MKRSELDKEVENRIELIKSVLLKKGTEYATGGDAFHNFNQAKGLSFHNSREKIAWEYSVKHLQSIKDIIELVDKGGIPSLAAVEEKFGDAINYLILIEAMIKESISIRTFITHGSN
jgi:hypothetical protein